MFFKKKKKIRVIQYGCGKMGAVFLRYLTEKGAEIVGAIDTNPSLVGRDIADIIGLKKKTGIIIENNAEKIFKQKKADVCIVAIASLMADMEKHLSLPLNYGVNVISTCEEAFYPWNTSKKITKRLDKLAKNNNCTITASGYQDVFWGNLISIIAGATHKIKLIEGVSSYNVEDYGIALAEVHGAGLSLKDFDKKIAKNSKLPSYMWNSNEWLASQLGWTVKSIKQSLVPTKNNRALKSKTLGLTIPSGHATGMSAIVTLETKEGPTIKTECIGKVYAKGEIDKNDWKISGEPDTRVVINQPATVELTCATIVNRLPQLINAPAGYITSEKLPPAAYLTKNLEHYLK
jgi:4-hydroxy-tetrahydrodipicolinate reductase